MPNTTRDGNRAIVIPIRHGVTIKWDGRLLIHCSSVGKTVKINNVFGTYFGIKRWSSYIKIICLVFGLALWPVTISVFNSIEWFIIIFSQTILGHNCGWLIEPNQSLVDYSSQFYFLKRAILIYYKVV